MPRRKNTDGGDSGQPVKQPRVRKKKEPPSICSTPTTEHPPAAMKLEMVHSMQGMPAVCGSGGPMDVMMGGGPPMHMQHLPNGAPCGAGPPHHQQIMEEGSNGPGGMGPPFGGGPPQHPHQSTPFEFYSQGPPTTGGPGPPPSQFMPPPMQMQMFGGGPPPGHPQMMMQQQGGQPQMGPIGAAVPGQQQFHPGPEDGQPHPQQQMMAPLHPHHPGAQPGPGPMSAPPGPPQMPPHQMPPQMFPGPFPPRQPPGPLMLFPPPSIPQPPFLEFRLQEMNRRLYQFHCHFYQQAQSEQTEQWWDAFSQEFFDENGRMTLSMHEYSIEQGGFVPKQYTVSRRNIPRFYRSLFSNGVSSLHYFMRSPAQEMVDPQRMQNPEMYGCCALNCENLLMVIGYDKPMQAEVHIECRLYVEFAQFNLNLGYRIRHWCMEMRAHQEFISKDGMQIQQLDGIDRKHLTCYGLPFTTHGELKMWQIVQRMEPIVERSKDTNESPQQALHQIVMENGQRMEMERQQRMAQAAAAAQAHIQSPSQHQPPGNGPPQQHPMAAIIGMPPQIPPGLPPGLLQHPQMGPPMGVPPQTQQTPTTVEEQKPSKPKRIRQRKSTAQQQQQAAAAAAAAAGAAAAGNNANNNNNNNISPPKGKKGGQSAAAQNAGQQTPPAGIPQMPSGFPPQMSGPPQGQFHQMGMPPGQYHHDVLTVGEPSMMGCEYGEQDERQISRVENTAFSGLNHHPSVSQGGPMMMGPPGSCGPSQPGGPQMTIPSSLQQQMGENSQSMLGDFMHSQQQTPQQLHHQQQQSLQMQPPTSMWAPPPDTSQQQAMSSGS